MIPVKAMPIEIRFDENRGYELRVQVTEGPANLIDRRITIPFTSKQLNAISEWDGENNLLLEEE